MKHIPTVHIAPREHFVDSMDRAIATQVQRQLAHLLQTAYECGYVITVDRETQPPLAMGNYRMVGNVRKGRV